MNIGYIKIKKQENVNTIKKTNPMGNADIVTTSSARQKIKLLANTVKNKLKRVINKVEQDKYKKNVFTVYNLNEKSKTKLMNKLRKENIDYIIVEGNKDIGYPAIEGKCAMRGMLPEIVDYCQRMTKPTIDEVHICTNIFNSENRKIVEELIDRVKVVNIVTNNKNYTRLEKRLEEKDIFITVSSNKRKSLKNATIVINLDFENLVEYNINRNMVLIDTTGKIELPKSFNGIVIRKILINTKKVMRVFSELEEFDRNKLIEAEMMKLEDYKKTRKFIEFNKIYIDGLYNIRKIETKEFRRIEENHNVQYNKSIKKVKSQN